MDRSFLLRITEPQTTFVVFLPKYGEVFLNVKENQIWPLVL